MFYMRSGSIRKSSLRYLFVAGNNGAEGLWKVNGKVNGQLPFETCSSIMGDDPNGYECYEKKQEIECK